jgi:hypothetical protein
MYIQLVVYRLFRRRIATMTPPGSSPPNNPASMPTMDFTDDAAFHIRGHLEFRQGHLRFWLVPVIEGSADAQNQIRNRHARIS